jgi:hypothetical protein
MYMKRTNPLTIKELNQYCLNTGKGIRVKNGKLCGIITADF